MSAGGSKKERLSELRPLRRNRYFEGRALTAADLTLEQDYWLERERLLNLHVFGSGVVSGLAVTTVQAGDDWGVRVSPGVAIDGCGRLIVVPKAHELVPIELTDEHGDPIKSRGGMRPGRLVVSLCYRECPADFTPTSSSDEPEAATWLETYAIRIRRGRAPKADDPCIVLANVSRAADGALDVEEVSPRQIVPTNQLLLGLVAALAEGVEKR